MIQAGFGTGDDRLIAVLLHAEERVQRVDASVASPMGIRILPALPSGSAAADGFIAHAAEPAANMPNILRRFNSLDIIVAP